MSFELITNVVYQLVFNLPVSEKEGEKNRDLCECLDVNILPGVWKVRLSRLQFWTLAISY